MLLLLLILLADCCILFTITIKKTKCSTTLASKLRLSAPLHHTAPIFLPLLFCSRGVFFLSTDTDVGGSKQKHVLLSKTCYQTCTRMYRFDNRSQKPHNSTIVHGWTWFCTVTSLTFRQTRVQALYMDVQRLIEDFRFNRCPKHYRP